MNPAVRHETTEDFGTEVVIPVGNLQLRADGEDLDGTSYVRVCDSTGEREIAYWTADEWKAEPEFVMGAIIGALCVEVEIIKGRVVLK